jgi:hypothetical protein
MFVAAPAADCERSLLALLDVGSSMAARMALMAITTNNSINTREYRDIAVHASPFATAWNGSRRAKP